MKQFDVTGMSCAACSSRVEKAVLAVDGVTSCSVNLLTNSMGVEGDASETDIIEAVKKAGYGASLKGSGKKSEVSEDSLTDTETPALKKRLIASLGFLAVLMYISMGHTMWGWYLPEAILQNHVAVGMLQMLLAAIVMVINQKFFINGFKGVINKSPNMDTLVALGSGASFVWSVYVLFAMTAAQSKGDFAAVHEYMHEFYFESAAMILTLITVGKMLEARSKGKTTDALKSLMTLAPKTATVIRNGEEIEIAVSEVKKGDVFVVKSGESIPVDGIITEGTAAVDESALTGESIPADKSAGDSVSAATINKSGYIRCEATRVGEDTTLSQIIKTVSEAAASKAPIARIADKVSGIFVPVVIAIAVITTVIWLLSGENVAFSLARGISVLVISCPCALGLATPVAIMVGSGVGAKNGILFKNAVSLEETGRVNIVALDKTGTITEGKPEVTDIITDGISENEFLQIAYSLEKKSEHPLAKAVVAKAEEAGISLSDSEKFSVFAGNGLKADIDGCEIIGGNIKFINENATVSDNLKNMADNLSENGKTPMIFARNGKTIGIIAVADKIKEDSVEAIKQLKEMGMRVVMLTGDNSKTAKSIGKQVGIEEVVSDVLPDGKEAVIRDLRKQGKVAMVGDGINDAPALTAADVGTAIGAGTDIAIDSADVVLMKSCITDVTAAIRLGRATLRNIHQNLFWAFIYNVIGIPLAAGLFIPVFGWELNPMFGAAAMSLSSFCVVSNALRLNFAKIYDENKIKIKENKNMVKTIKIEGMMCGHCEARVKKVLEAIPEVASADVNHETDTAVVTLNAPVSDDVLKNTVEAQDYKVISIA
ncbi:MAG: heavy metal translocating P-type ATPase [Clostridia bacterium]|nr:heavy metal translocating P-type ATPase [Clostridia bacterium]